MKLVSSLCSNRYREQELFFFFKNETGIGYDRWSFWARLRPVRIARLRHDYSKVSGSTCLVETVLKNKGYQTFNTVIVEECHFLFCFVLLSAGCPCASFVFLLPKVTAFRWEITLAVEKVQSPPDKSFCGLCSHTARSRVPVSLVY